MKVLSINYSEVSREKQIFFLNKIFLFGFITSYLLSNDSIMHTHLLNRIKPADHNRIVGL